MKIKCVQENIFNLFLKCFGKSCNGEKLDVIIITAHFNRGVSAGQIVSCCVVCVEQNLTLGQQNVILLWIFTLDPVFAGSDPSFPCS